MEMKRIKEHYAALRSKNKKTPNKPKGCKNIHFVKTKITPEINVTKTILINHKHKRIAKTTEKAKLKNISFKQINLVETQKKPKAVQICGLFNSGTNLVTNIISEIFDVTIGKEGHLDFWKHTVIGEGFAKKHIKKNTLYIVVTKNPYFQFHSFKKELYSIKTKDTKDINTFVKQNLSIKPPLLVVTDTSNLEFKNFPQYWNSFYRNTLKFIPNIIIVKYEDLLFDPHSVIDNLKKYMPLKNVNINDILSSVLNTPSKESGKPRFGESAKSYYDPQNIPDLFNHDTFQWINTRLDSDIMNALNYSFN